MWLVATLYKGVQISHMVCGPPFVFWLWVPQMLRGPC